MKKITMMMLVLIVGVISFNTTIKAQIKKFKWDGELCTYEGNYDSSKYTEKQLKNTQKLIYEVFSISLWTKSTVRKYEDIKKLSVEKLDKEYKEKSVELTNRDIVKTPYWEKIRQAKLKEMKQVYELKRLTIQAYEKPEVLKSYKRAECCRNFYVEPLITGGDYLLTTWLKLNMDMRTRNADPDRLKRRYEQQNASPNRLKFARLQVMMYGWWNCANHTIDRIEDENLQEKFEELFSNFKSECDEP